MKAASASNDVSKVLIDHLVLMKIVKHSKAAGYKAATGQLHGLFNEKLNMLEITNSYPIPTKEHGSELGDGDNYDASLMSRLDVVNLDNNKVGWYQVSYTNDHLNYNAYEAHFGYQRVHPFAVFLVYDIMEAEKGGKDPFKIYRIHENFMEMTKNKDIPAEKVKKLNLKYDKFFVEVPHEITYSPLAKAFFGEHQIPLKKEEADNKNSFLSFISRNTTGLTESVEELDSLGVRLNEEFLKGGKGAKKIEKTNYESEAFLDFLITLKKVNTFAEQGKNVGNLLTESSMLMKEMAKSLV